MLTSEDDLSQSMESVNLDDSGIQVYRRRWFIAAVVGIMNTANAMLWISYSSVTDFTSIFYEVSYDSVNLFAIIFPIVCIPLGLVSSYILDTVGLKVSMILCGVLDMIGAVLRIVSALPGLPIAARFPLAMTGQSFAAMAQPFVLFASTKTAAVWFPEHQRALANTLTGMANPLGILVANLLSPNIVKSQDHFLLFQIIYAIPATVALLMSFGMLWTGSEPELPPSRSAQQQHRLIEASYEFLPIGEGRSAATTKFKTDLKSSLKEKQMWILMFSFGIGMGLFTALSTMLEQVLCPRGYDDRFSGIGGALLIAFGLVGAGVAGAIVDSTGHFSLVAKISYAMAAIGAAAFAVVSGYKDFKFPIAGCISWFGGWGFAIYPVCLELAVEVTYPVGEAVSTGLLIVMGQIFSVILIFAMQELAVDMTPAEAQFSQCVAGNSSYADTTVKPQDYTVPTLVFASLAAVASVTLIAFFRSPYKRRAAEHVAAEAAGRATGAHEDSLPVIAGSRTNSHSQQPTVSLNI